MKKLLVLTAVAAFTATAFGQGIVQFQNRDTGVTPTVSAPIYLDAIGTGSVGALGGAGYRAALLGGPLGSTPWVVTTSGVNAGSGLSMLASPTTGATWVTFRTGAASGFVAVGSDAARTVPGVDWGASGVFQIVAWSGNANSWLDAVLDPNAKIGASAPLTIQLPSGPTDPAYAALRGLESFAIVTVPEPSTFALAGLGAAAMLIFRRRR